MRTIVHRSANLIAVADRKQMHLLDGDVLQHAGTVLTPTQRNEKSLCLRHWPPRTRQAARTASLSQLENHLRQYNNVTM